jgi:hypothetical protein
MEAVMTEAARESPLRKSWRCARRKPSASPRKSSLPKVSLPDVVRDTAMAGYAVASNTAKAAKAPAADSMEGPATKAMQAAKTAATEAVKATKTVATEAVKATATAVEAAPSAVKASSAVEAPSAVEASTAVEGSRGSQRCRDGGRRRQHDRDNRDTIFFHDYLSHYEWPRRNGGTLFQLNRDNVVLDTISIQWSPRDTRQQTI